MREIEREMRKIEVFTLGILRIYGHDRHRQHSEASNETRNKIGIYCFSSRVFNALLNKSGRISGFLNILNGDLFKATKSSNGRDQKMYDLNDEE